MSLNVCESLQSAAADSDPSDDSQVNSRYVASRSNCNPLKRSRDGSLEKSTGGRKKRRGKNVNYIVLPDGTFGCPMVPCVGRSGSGYKSKKTANQHIKDFHQ